MEEMNLENVIKELKRHKATETDHYRDCGECSRALEVAINHLEKENSNIDEVDYWQDKYLNLLERLETKLKEERERLNNHIGTFYKDSFTNRTIRTLEDILKEVDKKGI